MNFKADVKSETHRQNREELDPRVQNNLSFPGGPSPVRGLMTSPRRLTVKHDLPAVARPAACVSHLKKKTKHTSVATRIIFRAQIWGTLIFSVR